MEFIKALLQQYDKTAPLAIIFIGIGLDGAPLEQMGLTVGRALHELGLQHAYSAAIQFDLEMNTSNTIELAKGSTHSKRPILLLPIIGLRTLLNRPSATEASLDIIQRLHQLKSYNFLKESLQVAEEREAPCTTVIPTLFVEHRAPAIAMARQIAKLMNKQSHGVFIATGSEAGQDRFLKCDDGTDCSHQFAIRERWAPLSVAVLAAGKSSRMGRSKQIEPIDGIPMVVRAVTTALLSGEHNVYLVTGAYADDVKNLLDRKQLLDHSRLTLVHNSDYAEGQSTSVKAILNHLMSTEDSNFPHSTLPQLNAITFMPVDQPYLNPLLISRLCRLWRRGAQMVAPAVDGVPRGAPALFDRGLWPEFRHLNGDTGAKILLRQYRHQLITVETPMQDLYDIDTPADISLSN